MLTSSAPALCLRTAAPRQRRRRLHLRRRIVRNPCRARSVATTSAAVDCPAAAPQPPAARARAGRKRRRSVGAGGKRYPLTSLVTLGKEGKQVIELLVWVRRDGNCVSARVSPGLRQWRRAAGNRDLVAGDVIELIGVRLRFEVALAS